MSFSCFNLLCILQYRSCEDIKDAYIEAKTGYYWISVKEKMMQVYCDMDNHGINVNVNVN